MEPLLRGEEISEIMGSESLGAPWEDVLERAASWDGPAFFFPIRHHSPACTFHLKKVFEAYRPDCVLIEGPENAAPLLPVLSSPDAKAPMALYYFYKDTRGLLGKDKADYKCYYPFLDTSPELFALREARERGIPARFVDLAYGEILLGTAKDRGIRKGEKPGYNDDYLLSRSRFVSLLCDRTGLRSFDEFWEKYFEIQGLFMDTDAFIRQMLFYCALSRSHTPEEELLEDGCILRERRMAMRISEAAGEYRRILVVTGGFHTSGLLSLLKPDLTYTGQKLTLHGLTDAEQGAYPLAYSMEAADALNGYASGMPSPGFYERVWKGLTETGEAAGAYESAVLHQLTAAGREARRKKEGISSYDVICAFSMAKGLAALRGKREPGLYELQDAALSSFVKGEVSLSTDRPLRILRAINTGTAAGALPKDAPRPPILSDFEEQCRRFGFKLLGAEQMVTLELFTKKKHLAASRFLYQMEFLDTRFGTRKKGADLLGNTDRSRIREIWSVRFAGSVLAALADVSMSGGTVREAAKAVLLRRALDARSARESCRLMVNGFLMGFLGETAALTEAARQSLGADGDFFSLTGGFASLQMLYELRTLYGVEEAGSLSELLKICFRKLLALLPSMGSVEQEKETDCMKCFLSLYQAAGRPGFLQLRQPLGGALSRMLEQDPEQINPVLEGAALGILYGMEHGLEERIHRIAAGYLTGTAKKRGKSARFLRGLFYTARDLIFTGERFFVLIDTLLARADAEEFMALLPELRMAFGYFTPLETDRLAAKAAKLHGVSKKELLYGRPVSPLEYDYGEYLDAFAERAMAGNMRLIL